MELVGGVSDFLGEGFAKESELDGVVVHIIFPRGRAIGDTCGCTA